MDRHCTQPIAHLGIGRVQVLGDAQEMQIGPVVENGGAGRDANGAAQAAHQREEAACRLNTGRAKARQGPT